MRTSENKKETGKHIETRSQMFLGRLLAFFFFSFYSIFASALGRANRKREKRKQKYNDNAQYVVLHSVFMISDDPSIDSPSTRILLPPFIFLLLFSHPLLFLHEYYCVNHWIPSSVTILCPTPQPNRQTTPHITQPHLTSSPPQTRWPLIYIRH